MGGTEARRRACESLAGVDVSTDAPLKDTIAQSVDYRQNRRNYKTIVNA